MNASKLGPVLAILSMAAGASAATAVYKDEALDPFTMTPYGGAADTMLVEAANDPRNQNFGARADIEIGGIGAGGRRHGLIRFDITSMAGQFESIQSATLRLYFTVTPQGSDFIDAFRIAPANLAWVEGPGAVSDINNVFPGTSTWAERLRGNQSSNGPRTGPPGRAGRTRIRPTAA